MSITNKNYLIQIFVSLGDKLLQPDEELQGLIARETNYNAWFTATNVAQAVTSIGKMLNGQDLTQWLSKYDNLGTASKRVGLILAGNIPLVGFHDVLCVLASGHTALIKFSSQDDRLMRYVLKLLLKIAPEFAEKIIFVNRLADFDAVIATGSNNTSRYFDYYFGKVPNIIRKNRNSVAVLSGFETADDFKDLGHDIFDYFGLGCRNVSALLVPEGYNFNSFFEGIEQFAQIANHHKYNNNYDYSKAIYLVNGDRHFDNGFLLLKEDNRIASPLAVVFYQQYTTLDNAIEILTSQRESIQCVVSKMDIDESLPLVNFGQSQSPRLWDYADATDTMQFLANL